MRRTLIIILPIFLLVIVIGFVKLRGENITQPIRYNHQKHIEEAGLNCIDCHQNTETMAVAGIPRLQVCAECHEEALSEHPEEEKLLEFISNGTEIAWCQISSIPDNVYFSHRRHVSMGAIDCEICHGKMDKMTSPPKSPNIKLSMKFCMDCHDNMHADNDCIACHK